MVWIQSTPREFSASEGKPWGAPQRRRACLVTLARMYTGACALSARAHLSHGARAFVRFRFFASPQLNRAKGTSMSRARVAA